MIVDKTIQVSEASDSIGASIVDLIDAIQEALKDGFQPEKDLPPIMIHAMQNLTLAVQKGSLVPGEFQENMGVFIKTWVLSGADVAKLFLPQPKV